MRILQFGAKLALAGLVLVAGIYCVQLTIGLPSPFLEDLLVRWAGPFAPTVAALVIAARAFHGGKRSTGWLLIAIGQACWALGSYYYSIVLWTADPMPFPSLADAGWIVFYVPTFAGIILLAQERAGRRGAASVLDGAIAALAIAGVGAAIAFGAIVDASGGSPLAIATNLAYPLCDLAMLALVIGALAVSGWRLSRRWAGLALGLAVFAVADTLYVLMIAEGTYVAGTLIDSGWVLASTITALAAWQPEQAAAGRFVRGWSAFVFPALFGMVGLATLIYDHFRPVHLLALTLSAACVAAVIVRMMLIFRENLEMLRASRTEATTDALTGLGNRRKLLADLDVVGRTESLLVLLDLDGFKAYNDSFGHPAGDALLARLGRRLSDSIRPGDAAYRLGGDEFCVLATGSMDQAGVALRISQAMREHGDGFSVTSSYGFVSMPDDAATASDALSIADHRMYAQKQRRENSAGRQSKDVLLRALQERLPELADHRTDVAELAADVARRLGLPEYEIEQVKHAAELHDVGKVAVPDAILRKVDPLTEEDWGFIHQHTVIGERIISAAPALAHVARLVRSSHERWDGTGYPDRLAADSIPAGARILAVCDALAAMLSDRPYRLAVGLPAALAELDRCAGSQFDPEVVAAVAAELTESAVPLAAA